MDTSQSATAGGNGGSGGNGMLIPQTNDMSSPASAADDSMQKLNQVINSIQKTLGLIHQLYLTVSTYNTAFQMPLLQRMYFSPILFSSCNFFLFHFFPFLETATLITFYFNFKKWSCFGA